MLVVVIASLLGGGPAGAYESGTTGVMFTPVTDLDGDGRPDMVSLSRMSGAAGVASVSTSSPSAVLALRGVDGAQLWRTVLDFPVAKVVDVRLANGRGAVLAVGGDSISGPSAFGGPSSMATDSGERALQLTMLDARGDVVWARTFDAGQRAQMFPVGDADRSVQVFRSYAAFAGTLSAVADSTSDVLVTVTDRIETPARIESTTSVLVLDGATGETATQTVVELTDARPRAVPVADLDGDGRDDVLVASPGTGDDAGIRALAGDSLTTLWDQPSTELPALWSLFDAGDLDGDGVADPVLHGYDTAVITTYGGFGPMQRIAAFSGASGAPLVTADASNVIALGDVDGESGAELGLQTAMDFGTLQLVRYDAITAAGDVAYSEEHEISTGTDSVELSATLGDVDGDGIGDAAHGMSESDDQDVVISGRTGRVLRHGPVATPIGELQPGGRAKQARVAATDATGRVTVSLLDGLTGQTQWTSPALQGGTSAVYRTADVNGDGVLDVVLDFVNANPNVGAVLDGVSGAVQWQTSNVAG